MFYIDVLYSFSTFTLFWSQQHPESMGLWFYYLSWRKVTFYFKLSDSLLGIRRYLYWQKLSNSLFTFSILLMVLQISNIQLPNSLFTKLETPNILDFLPKATLFPHYEWLQMFDLLSCSYTSPPQNCSKQEIKQTWTLTFTTVLPPGNKG